MAIRRKKLVKKKRVSNKLKVKQPTRVRRFGRPSKNSKFRKRK